MSNNVNTDLLERAAEMVAFWEGNKIADEVQSALDSNDLELVWQVVTSAEAEAARQEMYGYDAVPTNESDTSGDFSGASYDEWGGR